MRYWLIICAALSSCFLAVPQDRRHPAPLPTQFEIGRYTFFDFGPPFNFYDVFLVRPSDKGTSVTRISLTPAGNECFDPAKIEVASASLNDPVASLFGSTNPCAIPEKELKREKKRCKGCLVFSGANIVMQVQCGAQTRLIRADILDRDIFDSAAKTPEHTSWTMQLLEKLDQPLGPGVMDKPIFAIPKAEEKPAEHLDSQLVQEVSEGKYDVLFQGAPDKPSEICRAAQIIPSQPTVQLKVSLPVSPEVYVKPIYPMIARMAHVEGAVSIKFTIRADGGVSDLVFENGPMMLRYAVGEAAKQWKFSKDASSKEGQATIQFATNCPKMTN